MTQLLYIRCVSRRGKNTVDQLPIQVTAGCWFETTQDERQVFWLFIKTADFQTLKRLHNVLEWYNRDTVTSTNLWSKPLITGLLGQTVQYYCIFIVKKNSASQSHNLWESCYVMLKIKKKDKNNIMMCVVFATIGLWDAKIRAWDNDVIIIITS